MIRQLNTSHIAETGAAAIYRPNIPHFFASTSFTKSEMQSELVNWVDLEANRTPIVYVGESVDEYVDTCYGMAMWADSRMRTIEINGISYGKVIIHFDSTFNKVYSIVVELPNAPEKSLGDPWVLVNRLNGVYTSTLYKTVKIQVSGINYMLQTKDYLFLIPNESLISI